MINHNDLIIIDEQKYYWDVQNECLIPIEFEENNNLNLNSNSNIKIENEWYMENYNIEFWESLLARPLDKDELKIIHGVWNENSMNVDIKVLQKNLVDKGCYIKSITNNVGNCLFESIASLELGENDLGIKPQNMIRKNIAAVLLLVKNSNYFFPKIELTPEELFNNINDIGFVKDNKTGEIFEYDYDMMIYDLNSNFSWERLPTELILMTISKLYNVEIHIHHNKDDYINKINVFTEPQEIIRLGQINEEHYFPILELPDEFKFDPEIIDEILQKEIKYDKYINKFKEWSKIIMDSIISNNTNNSNNSNNLEIKKNESNELNELNESNNFKIFKTNKNLTEEQIKDYDEISNFDNFSLI